MVPANAANNDRLPRNLTSQNQAQNSRGNHTTATTNNNSLQHVANGSSSDKPCLKSPPSKPFDSLNKTPITSDPSKSIHRSSTDKQSQQQNDDKNHPPTQTKQTVATVPQPKDTNSTLQSNSHHQNIKNKLGTGDADSIEKSKSSLASQQPTQQQHRNNILLMKGPPSNPQLALKQLYSQRPKPHQSGQVKLTAPASHARKTTPPTAPSPSSVQAVPPMFPPVEKKPSILKNFDPNLHSDQIKQLRAPLTEGYGPFIQPTDTSIHHARERLKTALDQTRQLRQAFTDRVYEKYRILLKPVQSSVDAIVGRIQQDPNLSHSRLEDEIRSLREEREIEKREAQKLGAIANSDASQTVSAQETMEQLQYISAGLNLVVLPEDDINATGIDVRKYQHRGPINPETGQRVGGISAAAATAAELLLDRVRRSHAMRSDRIRRQALTGDTQPTLTRLPLVSTTSGTSAKSNNRHSSGGKRRQSSKSQNSTKNKSRTQQNLGTAHMLTLNSNVEDLGTNISASTAALISRGVGIFGQRTTSHPHPKSLGGQKAASTNTGRRTDLHPSGLELPPVPSWKMGDQCKRVKLVDHQKSTSKRAANAIRSVLKEFVSVPSDGKSAIATGNDNLRATEIRLLRGLEHYRRPGHLHSWGANGVNASDHMSQKVNSSVDKKPIDPALAFSVLHGIGLVGDTTSQKRSSASLHRRLDGLKPVLDGKTHDAPETKGKEDGAGELASIHRALLTKKRSFSEAFFRAHSTEQEEGKDSKIKKTSPLEVAQNHARIDPSKNSAVDSKTNTKEECPVISLRGGGDDPNSIEDENGMPNLDDIMDLSAEPAGDTSRVLHSGMGEEKCSSIPSPPHPSPSVASGNRFSAPAALTTSEAAIERVLSRPSSASSATTSQSLWTDPAQIALLNNQLRASSSDGFFSVMDRRSSLSGATSTAKGPQIGGGSLSHALQKSKDLYAATPSSQHHLQGSLQHVAAISRLQNTHNTSDLSDLLAGGIQQSVSDFAGSRAEWAMAGSALNLLPSHSPLATLGSLNPSRATLVGLSARDRAARALLAREQQQNMAAVAHAAAVQRQAMRGVSGLSQQHAALLMGQSGQTLFGGSANTGSGHIAQYGAPSAATAAAIMNSTSASSFLNSTHLANTSLSSQSMEDIRSTPQTSSRPSSRQSKSSSRPSSAKSQRPSSSQPATVLKQELKDANFASRPESTKNADVSIATKEKASIKKPQPAAAKDPKGMARTPEKPAFQKAQQKEVPAKPKINPEPQKPENSKISISPPLPDKAKPSDVAIPAQKQTVSATQGNAVSRSDPKTPDESKLVVGPKKQPEKPTTQGMRFFIPNTPQNLDSSLAADILRGRVHSVIQKSATSPTIGKSLLEYLHAVGTAVPIPKALVSSPLKERLSQAGKQTSSHFLSQGSKELVISAILVWLWAQHKDSFERAFSKRGRIDVDPECKWLISAAVDAAARALMLRSDGSKNLPSSHVQALKQAGSSSKKHSSPWIGAQAIATRNELDAVAVVNEALMSEVCIDETVDGTLPLFDDLVKLLDETRMCALRSKCRERALLAALIARSVTMSESFANAYTSSIVRAGEAIGHEELFELVQSEETMTSTMIPYDIFSDAFGAWEDPCRPRSGYPANLRGVDLVKRAHARAMIHKSLKIMQDSDGIGGGVTDAGPYVDPSPDSVQETETSSMKTPSAPQRATSGAGRRRSTLSFSGDTLVKAGTGAGKANSWALYNPNHHSVPLIWDSGSIENKPYGKYAFGTRSKSLCPVHTPQDTRRKRRRSSSSPPGLITSNSMIVEEKPDKNGVYVSSREVDIGEVARTFQVVSLSQPSKRAKKEHGQSQSVKARPRKIIAPFCNRIDSSEIKGVDSDPEDEEKLSDEVILGRHQAVMSKMKEKVDRFMERRNACGRGSRGRAADKHT